MKKKKNFKTLAATIATAFLSVTLLSLIVSVTLQSGLSFLFQKELIGDYQELLALRAADQIKNNFDEHFLALQEISNTNNLTKTAEDRQFQFSKVFGRDGAIRQIFLLNESGEMTDAISKMSNAKNQLGVYKERIIAATANEQRYISPVYIHEETNEPLVLIAVPKLNRFREPVGAVAAEVNLKFMWDLVSSLDVGEGGHTFVVDRQGNLLAYSDISRVLARENLSHKLAEVGEFVYGKDLTFFEDLFHSGIEGNYVVSRYAELPEVGWAVVVEMSPEIAYRPIIRSLGLSIAVVIASFIASMFLAVWLARRISKPITDLSIAAASVSAGNMNVEIDESSPDEIGYLASSFNQMMIRLRDVYGSLEKRVNEKTSELSRQVAEGERSRKVVLNLLEEMEVEKKKVEGVVQIRTRELAAEKARLIASINSLSFGFLLADQFDHVTLKNPALKHILGYEKDPESIHDIAQVLQVSDSKFGAEIVDAGKKCMEMLRPMELKEVPFGKNSLRIICLPVIVEKAAIGYILLFEDITEEKALERGKEEFFSIASHELRTPLTAIRGNASMLLDSYADKINDPEVHQMLQDIYAAGGRLIKIVNDFLEVSRIEQGRLRFENQTFNIVPLIEEVISEIMPLAQKKQLYVKFEGSMEPAQVYADRDRTKQVLVNLIANAINYTKSGGITVHCVQEAGVVRARVSDTGIGISMHNQSLLFRKFQQAGDTLARDVTESTGLGLYISRRIIEGMGGTIELERSEPNVGSTFAFTLPLISAKEVNFPRGEGKKS